MLSEWFQPKAPGATAVGSPAFVTMPTPSNTGPTAFVNALYAPDSLTKTLEPVTQVSPSRKSASPGLAERTE